jgi:hypothetical protein
MNDHSYHNDRHDPFGWFKTIIAVLVVFGLMITTGMMAARADGCADACRAKHNECRVQTKGSPQCDTQVNACVQQCIAALAKVKK